MTDAQIFQVLGIVLAVLGVSWVINPGAFRHLIKDMSKNEGVLFLMGMLTVFAGYAILALHTTDFMLVTVLGWITLLKGIAIIFFPAFGWSVYALLKKMDRYFTLMPWVTLLVGLGCLYLGYWA